MLVYGLESILKLSHPFAPFVTETIWQTLEVTGDSMLITQTWPEALKYDDKLVKEYEEIQNIVVETRGIVSAMQLEKTSLYHTAVPFLSQHAELIAQLARIEGVHDVEDGRGLHLTSTLYKCWLDIDRERAEKYSQKLIQTREDAKKRVEGLQKRLENKNYVKQAPKNLVEETKQQIIDSQQLIENINGEIERFNTV